MLISLTQIKHKKTLVLNFDFYMLWSQKNSHKTHHMFSPVSHCTSICVKYLAVQLIAKKVKTLCCQTFVITCFPFQCKINASLRAVPVYRKHLGRAGAWNIFRNNFEEYATTNETDFMGSVTMSPASGRQKSHMKHFKI